MPFTSENFGHSTLTDILRTVIETKQTGYLKVHDTAHDGCVAIENGVILHAKAGTARGLPALFDFVGWRDPRIEFHERPMPVDVTRDLAVYDPQVLLTGLSYKVAEHNLVHDATPGLDEILKYGGSGSHSQLEATPGDLKLLSLADGRRSVRVIAEEIGLAPSEAARLIPVKSVNAIDLGARVLQSVRELEAHWAVTKSFPGLPLGMNTISPGAIFAGAGIDADGLPVVTNNPGIVPDTCTLDFDLKFLPNEKTEDVRRDFEAWIARFAATDPWLALNPPKVIWNLAGLHFPPVNTAIDDPLCEAVAASVRDAGEAPRFEGMLGVTDAAHYAKHGISTIVYGPAGVDAHAPDESVSIASTARAARVIASTIVRYCGARN